MVRKKRMLFYLIFLAITLCTILVITCNQIIEKNTEKYSFDDLQLMPYNKVGLLLGTSPKLKNGKNNLYFDYRITATVKLYKANKIRYILISGDNHRENYNEPEEMKKTLVAQGIPEHAIYMDYAGFRTLDSVIRAKKIFGQNNLTIISQKFHNERAIYLARKSGMNAIGFNAEDVQTYAALKTQVRELFARVKVFVDLIINKQPHFLGEKLIIKE